MGEQKCAHQLTLATRKINLPPRCCTTCCGTSKLRTTAVTAPTLSRTPGPRARRCTVSTPPHLRIEPGDWSATPESRSSTRVRGRIFPRRSSTTTSAISRRISRPRRPVGQANPRPSGGSALRANACRNGRRIFPRRTGIRRRRQRPRRSLAQNRIGPRSTSLGCTGIGRNQRDSSDRRPRWGERRQARRQDISPARPLPGLSLKSRSEAGILRSGSVAVAAVTDVAPWCRCARVVGPVR